MDNIKYFKKLDNFNFKFNKIKDTKVNRILLNKYSKLEKELKEIENNFNIHDINHLFRPNQIRKQLEKITRSLKIN